MQNPCAFMSAPRALDHEKMFQGTIDGASLHPREVVKEALKQDAAAVILANPHPSEVAEPSQADEFITTRLKEALGLVDIRVLDQTHIRRPVLRCRTPVYRFGKTLALMG
jgi:DNA repair protein RadC